MMDAAQKEVVSLVYRRFLESESADKWTDLDENCIFYDWLMDNEIVLESMVKLSGHSKGAFRCNLDHKQPQDCFAPYILEAVEAIVDLYKETEDLHPHNRYILIFYLVMSEMNLIYSD